MEISKTREFSKTPELSCDHVRTTARLTTLPPDGTRVYLMPSLLLPPAPGLLYRQMYPRRTEEPGRVAEAANPHSAKQSSFAAVSGLAEEWGTSDH